MAASIPQAVLGTGTYPACQDPFNAQVDSLAGNVSKCSTVQDENLKNLMMSWYYAGYYTGLVAGQQQAASDSARAKEQK